MRKILLIFALFTVILSSCTDKPEKRDSYVGTFVTEFGTKFILRADSTASIIFSDSVKYEATWKKGQTTDNWEFVNIEFGGYPKYYYLHDGKLYRSERQMRFDGLGEKIQYQD